MSDILYCNDVVVQGTIVHKYSTDKVTILTISTGKATQVVNYPKFVFFEETKKEADKFEKYDNVQIKANVQSSRRFKDGKRFYTQSCIGESIKRTPRDMERIFGINEGKYEDPINQVELAGELVSAEAVSDNILKILLKIVKNNRLSYVQVFQFTNKAIETADKLFKGDNVCVVGNIQTIKKERLDNDTNQTENVYYENIVAKTLRKRA